MKQLYFYVPVSVNIASPAIRWEGIGTLFWPLLENKNILCYGHFKSHNIVSVPLLFLTKTMNLGPPPCPRLPRDGAVSAVSEGIHMSLFSH